MSESILNKWNARYAEASSDIPAPAKVLSDGVRWLPEAGVAPDVRSALDLACGKAGNGHYLAQRGFRVQAWDISEAVIEQIRARQPSIIEEAVVRDVSAQPPERESFDIIVVTRFLDHDLCPAIADALKPGGLLFYQTFVHGLNNPDYLLDTNELLSLFTSLHVLEYHEPERDESGNAEARLVARRN